MSGGKILCIPSKDPVELVLFCPPRLSFFPFFLFALIVGELLVLDSCSLLNWLIK